MTHSTQVPKPCPTCKTDIAEYLAHAAINTEMAELIRRLQDAAEAARRAAEAEAADLADGNGNATAAAAARSSSGAAAGSDDDDDEDDEEEEEEREEDCGEEQQQQQPEKEQEKEEEMEAAPCAAEGPGKGAVAGAAPLPTTGRYGSELSRLAEAFPEFDAELIGGLLEDQGGDAEEVHAYLKVSVTQCVTHCFASCVHSCAYVYVCMHQEDACTQMHCH
jgi:hypothetical protein